MQTPISCIILASIFFLSFPNYTQAAPAPFKRPGMLTLPLRALHRVDAGNQFNALYLRKAFNHANKRFAHLTGREPPSFQRLALSPVKRDLNDAKTPTDVNSLGLDIDGPDFGYVAIIQIGTPPRNFRVLMDSGSADLWVGSENCQGQDGGSCGNHTFLGTDSSSSLVSDNIPWQITYGTGSVTGTKVRDTVVVAGSVLQNHQFGVANIESKDFTGADFDGLMGLAQSGLSNQKVGTPVEALTIAGSIPEAIVSYKISRSADNLHDGEITFGGLDETKFDPTTLVTVENVNPAGFWSAVLEGVSVEGKDLGIENRTAILDTGTSLIFVPREDARSIYAQIQGANIPDDDSFITVPCGMTESVAFTFGGRSFSIDPRDMAPGKASNSNDCVSGIQISDNNNQQEWLVGDVFLKNAYFSTNVQRNSISLAKLS